MAADENSDPRVRLEALEAKLAAKRARTSKPHMEEHYSQAQHAWRMVIELVAGLAIGFGIGLGLDALLSTKPWLMIVFTLLGFAAGVNVVIRSAKEIEKDSLARSGDDSGGDAGGGNGA